MAEARGWLIVGLGGRPRGVPRLLPTQHGSWPGVAPRGIVAAASASTFSAGLVKNGVGGASKILPVTFLVIVATVTLYGLTAAPVARRLRVTRPDRTRPLLVGGEACG
ncbi:MAG: hypothetical protein QOG28_5419 [Trebonia sp.]|jgi:NhaP-type Na+/H+ or K+/H+ antiporter|nr:hypothetical protein [Trebonia sp.]